MSRIVIIGGGISGLALAWHLERQLPRATITVLEANNRPGGMIWTEARDGFRLELGASGFYDSKASALRLCRQLGLESELVAAGPEVNERFLYLNDALEPWPVSLSAMLASPLLTLRSKWRLASERYRRCKRDAGDESLHDFIARRTTAEVADLFGDAFATATFAGDVRKLSLPAAFPRLFQAEREFGSVTRGLPRLLRLARAELAEPGKPLSPKLRLWSFKAGMRVLVETLAARLAAPPHLGVPARTLEVTAAGGRPLWQVHAEGRDALAADVVVLTCPAARQAAMLADLDEELADLLLTIPYVALAVVSLGYKREGILRPVAGHGFIAPRVGRRELLGVEYSSNLWPERAPDGCILLRALCGGWHRPEVMRWDDDRLSMVVRQELRQTLGILRRPVMMRIARWDPALPQYTVGHLERIHRIEQRAARHPGLFLGGSAFRGIAINDCIEDSEYLARRIADYVQASEK
jgi:oxygen-dependent protoporphyrinogen oxidase